MNLLGQRFEIVILLGKDDLTEIEKLEKIISFVYIASEHIDNYFNICISLDFKMNFNEWNGEDIILFKTNHVSNIKSYLRSSQVDNSTKDSHAYVTAVRHKNSKFGHYLYALLYGLMDKRHNNKIRQSLAWYFTLKLTETAKYVRPNSSTIDLDKCCLDLVSKLQGMTGSDFLKDYAIGRALTQRVTYQKILKD